MLRVGSREDWAKLKQSLGLEAVAFGIGLDRAKPYAGREGTNVACHVKGIPTVRGKGVPGLYGVGGNGVPPLHDIGWAEGAHIFEIASVDCPDGTDEEIEEAIEAIETIVGRRIPKIYEEYQAADLAIEHDADLVSATTQRQIKLFNRVHRLVREGRYHCSPESVGLKAEYEEFMVDTSHALPRFEHSSGATDDRIYGHAYSVEATAAQTLIARRFAEKPRGM